MDIALGFRDVTPGTYVQKLKLDPHRTTRDQRLQLLLPCCVVDVPTWPSLRLPPSTRRAPCPLLYVHRSAADAEIVEAFDACGEFIRSADARFSHRLLFLFHVILRPLLRLRSWVAAEEDRRMLTATTTTTASLTRHSGTIKRPRKRVGCRHVNGSIRRQPFSSLTSFLGTLYSVAADQRRRGSALSPSHDGSSRLKLGRDASTTRHR
jgi:hypothetical protein